MNVNMNKPVGFSCLAMSEASHRVPLTRAEIAENIRRLMAHGESLEAIAKLMRRSVSTVRRYLRDFPSEA